VNISAAGGLEALQFVQGPVESALYGGLVAGCFGTHVSMIVQDLVHEPLAIYSSLASASPVKRTWAVA
jgi:hypothetical protein